MAITKERLEELIEKEESAWYIKNNKVKQGWFVKNGKYFGFRDENYISVNAKEYFETKEEAEEYVEFGNVTRTDNLKIPFWKDVLDICKTLEEQKRYTKIIYEFDDVELKIYKDNGIWFISIWNYDYDALLSRENYDNARRLCVKLFKGESND